MPLSDSSVICLGASHAAVPLDVLERLSLPQERIAALLDSVGSAARQTGTRTELLVLSTCNRTEIYAVRDARFEDRPNAVLDEPPLFAGVSEAAIHCLEDHANVRRDELAAVLYRFDSGAAEEHLFRVVAGLDSLVVGETQIIGQVSRAYSAAQRAGTAGPMLSLLFESAIRTSRRTRVRASRDAGGSSAAAVAVRRAEEHVGSLSGAHVLVMGTGEMGRLVLPALREKRVGGIDIMTRSADRAAALSKRWGLPVKTPADLPLLLEKIDIVISSTSSAGPLITEPMLRCAMGSRAGQPLVIVDLAVPRSIEKQAAGIPGITLLDIESLRTANADAAGDDPAAAAIIREELAILDRRMAEMALRPVIGDMWRKADRFREEVLLRTRARVPQLDDQAWTHVENLARALVAKILHDPATRLRAQAGNGHAREYADALRHLFALSEPPEEHVP